MGRTSFDKNRIRILLLEGVHPCAVERFAADGYENVTRLDHALQGDELASAIADVHMLGIRSRTQLTGAVLDSASRLMAV
ncbi:MAG: phosphoglycerate dehydrogenase, partial [Gammaproteobacteria bacterium]